MSAAAVHIQCLQTQRLSSRAVMHAPVRLNLREMLLPFTLFSVLLLQLWVRVSFIGQSYMLEELRQKALKNDLRLREQRLQYALLSKPDELSRRAQSRLHLQVLEPQNVRKFPSQGVQ